jgi:hypothetical protein
VVFLDEEAGASDYTIVVESGADFAIDETGKLTVPSMTSADKLTVTTFDNDKKMDMRTHVFAGNPEGFYNLTTTRNGRAWLTIDGKRLVENVDYTIEEKESGSWDIDPFERFVYDSFRLVQLAIRFPGEQPPRDVVISTFEGVEAHPARSWQLSTKAPEEMRLLPLDADNNLRYLPKKAWELSSLDYVRRSGELLADVEPRDDTISLKLNPTGAPTKMIPSQPLGVPANEKPEVIWIGGERIEYFGYERSGNTVTLTELRRGTRGTAMVPHSAGDVALAIHDLDRMPPSPKLPPRHGPDKPIGSIDARIHLDFDGEGDVTPPA